MAEILGSESAQRKLVRTYIDRRYVTQWRR